MNMRHPAESLPFGSEGQWRLRYDGKCDASAGRPGSSLLIDGVLTPAYRTYEYDYSVFWLWRDVPRLLLQD
jgi:hypothetical protein